MNISKQEYMKMAEEASRNSNWKINTVKAFAVGGLICVIGEALIKLYSYMGADDKSASAWCSITLVAVAVLLTSKGLYEKIAKHGGAGTLVPITGFANSVAAPALEFKTEGYVLGVGTKIFTIAGPVILYGITAGVVYGMIYRLWLAIPL